MDFTSIGGRRFALAVGLSAMSAALLYFGKLSSADFASILNWNIVALVAGHSTDKFAKAKNATE